MQNAVANVMMAVELMVCSAFRWMDLHGGIIPVSVPPEVPLRELPYNAVVELVNPVADTVSRKTYTGAEVDWYVKAEDIILKNKGNQNAGNPQNQQSIKKG